MRVALIVSLALVASPAVLAQTADKAPAQQPKATATKPAAKAPAEAKPAATQVDRASAVRSTPATLPKGSEKSYDGCGSKGSANDA